MKKEQAKKPRNPNKNEVEEIFRELRKEYKKHKKAWDNHLSILGFDEDPSDIGIEEIY